MVEMIDDDLIRQLSEDGSSPFSACQSDTPEHESNHEKSWRLMFPEATVDDNTTEDDPPTPTLDNVISVEVLDDIPPIAVVLERSESARKSVSSSSGSSSDDLIFPGENLLKHSSASNSEVKVQTDRSPKTGSLLLHSPPVQEMHRDGNYDINRIPSAVFKRNNSVAPGEWSVASNDSLFSLQLGNNASIDREQSVLLSGEFKKLEDLSDFIGEEKEQPKSPPTIPTKTSKTSISLSDSNDVESEGSEDQTSKIITDEVQEMLTKIDEEKQQPRQSVHSSSISLRSNTSEDSNYSFAFPLLDDGEKNIMPKGPKFPMSHHPIVIPEQKVSRSKCCFYGLPGCGSLCSLLSCFSCFSCKSCTSCFSCKSCTSCFPEQKVSRSKCCFYGLPCCGSLCPLLSCFSCFSCKSCTSCFSCKSCTSCFSCDFCTSCPSCFSCFSCSLCPSSISGLTCRFCSCCTTKKSLSLKCC